MNMVSFPGLGIFDITMNPVAFSVFGKDVYWYGIIIVSGPGQNFSAHFNASGGISVTSLLSISNDEI